MVVKHQHSLHKQQLASAFVAVHAATTLAVTTL